LGELPKKMKEAKAKEKDPWAITFARREPVSLNVGDNTFSVTVRGRRYFKGKESYPGMEVTANYKVVKDGKTCKAVRDGELRIFPPKFKPGEDQLSARESVIRTLLLRRFGDIFKPELAMEGFTPKGRLEGLGKMVPVELKAKDGWISTAWRQATVK